MIKINSGTILPTQDQHGNPLFTTKSHLEDRVEIFHTSGAAAFWLWLIEERVKGAQARRGIAA